MIRVYRPATAPKELRTKGASLARKNARAFQRDPQSFRLGKRTFDFDRRIYAADEVKQALLTAQHRKCAFCESKPLAVSAGDIEHFRPKAAVRQSDRLPLDRPGYYWLAYEWTNLLFSCERCNRRHKGSAFPLANPKSRVRTPADSLDAEVPLFIDPSIEDPALFVSFRDHVPFAIDGNRRGARTIETLGLRRQDLNERREEHLNRLKCLLRVLAEPQVSAQLKQEVEALLVRMAEDSAEYSLMSRIAIECWRAGAKPKQRARQASWRRRT